MKARISSLASWALCLVAILATQSALGQFIYINLSYKVVLNPADGSRPSDMSDSAIQSSLTLMNQFLDSYNRGYRVRLADPITQIGGMGQTDGPSKWFNTDFFSDHDAKGQMQNDARLNSAAYAWKFNSINIYITQATGDFSGGVCSFPENDEIIIVSGNSIGDASTVLHEIGHFFGLYHTQGKSCGCCDTCGSPGEDFMEDTLEDRACWDRNDIANHNFQSGYGILEGGQRQQVDNVFHNLMSYRGSSCGPSAITDRLTELQLDRWTEAANYDRARTRSGQTWFVDSLANCERVSGRSKCVYFDVTGPVYGPANRVGAAVDAANASGGDVLMIRPGTYPENITITKPVTLRASRLGGVTIGN